ncbi:dihydrofolate reductase family protein [Paenibacillus sp. P32E]|uniref:dihydrofolate reductase family protein n=1 Tax=Paenibacillus sp. P32E TaxID=1349434 RepID=UPI00093F6825|nr:dihydrofolate reductase family protein [Paenibacillus sp. P32E]OKP82950.1 deaminase [Paenibacillus sp. P32E]
MKQSKVVLYVAMSLDGYIARLDGSVDWLYDVQGDGGDNGYGDFYKGVGVVVMGRLTYDEVLKISDEFPYAGKPCYVLTRREQAPDKYVHFTDEALDSLIPRLQTMSDGDVWLVGGGQLVQAFLEHELIDEVQLTLIPKLLGEGIPLFPAGTVPGNLKLTGLERMGQMASIHYEVIK